MEGGMDAFGYDNFLLEEKHRELEKLPMEQAVKERLAEEQRQREAEKAASEADRAQARAETEKRRGMLQELMKKTARSVDDVWYMEPSEFKGEDMVKLYLTEVQLASSDTREAAWWSANVVVPDQAFILDWVFADGPPRSATVYDNNHREDFHAIVQNIMPEELYWVEEEHQIYRKLLEERRLREEAVRGKAEKTARMKAGTEERTLKRFLLSQKHIVYAEPLDVQAGSTVTVFYNPANTVLIDNGSHVNATVKIPLDAYMMDFVFFEKEDGEVFYNREGMDYHIPVSGGIAKEPSMHIVHIAFKIAPIARKTSFAIIFLAISAWYDGQDWFNNLLCQKVMEQDWPWNKPALDYLELYHSARK
ncbi:hypothetical protein POTOM_040363 [Populus tomentosa]|uniref:starch synthase n=1 Tax=Populus tomentosa TaxID=118781 RepID=A0A8X7YNY5_POPTO|nr:hypothetical protein POTOM_040363 [Populus tomentosa]